MLWTAAPTHCAVHIAEAHRGCVIPGCGMIVVEVAESEISPVERLHSLLIFVV